jgi:hypothetical protein
MKYNSKKRELCSVFIHNHGGNIMGGHLKGMMM